MPPRKKKKGAKGAQVAIILVFVMGVIGAAYLGYLWLKTEDTSKVHYRAFGIDIPGSYAIHGIDVSRYQQRISWESVREMEVNGIRLGFAFIKATEGARNVDPYFKRNWKKSKEAGMVRGAYHFFIPTKSGKVQAQNFMDEVTLEPGDLPPVLDVEQASGVKAATIRKEVKAWLAAAEAFYKVKPIIYANISFYKRYLEGYFEDYPLWIAHYLEPNQPRIERDWSFWQHSETGRVDGILSKVDFNVFNGDSIQFRNMLVGSVPASSE